MNDKVSIKQEKHDTALFKITFSVLLLLVAFLAELYSMINMADEVIYIIVFGILMILFAAFLVITLVQFSYQKRQREEEQYDGIFKSEKASYLLIRSNFEKIEERLKELEKDASVPAEEITKIQKAVAKVSISRSKENADAILNSNDQILNVLLQLGTQLDNDLSERERGIKEQANRETMVRLQELQTEFREAELAIRNELLSVKSAIAAIPQTVQQPQPVFIPTQEQPQPQPAFESTQEQPQPLQDTEQMTPQPAFEPAEKLTISPELIQESSNDEPVIPEAPVIVPEITNEEKMQETGLDSELESLLDSIPNEPVPEIKIENEPVEPTIPDFSDDPNHVMTPEEIAALLESAVSEVAPESAAEQAAAAPEAIVEPEPSAAAPEAIVEPEPSAAAPEAIVEPEPIPAAPVVEDKPPMPDLSDPNHVMTPEEIAALIANS